MALMHLARRWLDLLHRDAAAIAVVTVDHKLRAESEDEARFVAEHARLLGFAHTTLDWTGQKPKTGIQAAARQARYELIAEYCRSHAMACAVTAHTEDDQAETFLMRLRRGSGVDGLAAMTTVSEQSGITLVRPLLMFSKARLLAYLRASSIPFVHDPSNENAAFERVRLRPAMAALAKAGVARSSLARSAARVGRSRQALDKITDDFLKRHFRVLRLAQCELSSDALNALPEDIALRALARVLTLTGGQSAPPRLARLERLLELVRAGKSALTLNGCALAVTAGTLKFYREPGRMNVPPLSFEPGAALLWDRRFVLTFGAAGGSDISVRQLGADGWLSYRKMMKEKGLPVESDRLAALTTPALWKKNQLMCAPALDFVNAEPGDSPLKPAKATLAPELNRYASPLSTEASSVLGKDTPIPYL